MGGGVGGIILLGKNKIQKYLGLYSGGLFSWVYGYDIVEIESGTGIFLKNITDAIFSICKSSKRPDIHSIIVKDNATNIGIRALKKLIVI